jgi:RNA 2',3'-cyclic 3'-phosphodiesterase
MNDGRAPSLPPPLPSERLFVAVPLPDRVRGELASHIGRSLGPEHLPGRVVAPENWHITLRFLGDTDRRARDTVVAVLRSADLGSPFDLEFTSMGAFPKAERARVLWVGTGEGATRLRELAADAERAAIAAGLDAERKPFAAHLTLSRLKYETDVARLLARIPPFGVAAAVDRVVLFRSRLSREGATYEVLERFSLRTAGS